MALSIFKTDLLSEAGISMLFVYHWEVISENPIIIRGHGLDEQNNYNCIIVDDYQAFCYYLSRDEAGTWLPSSDDIYESKRWKKKYSRFKQDLKGSMSEVSVIPMFTATTGLDYTGWIDVGNQRITKVEKNVHPNPLVLSFDIEVSSQDNSMVVPYKEQNQIEMISCIFKRYNSDKTDKYLISLSNVVLDDVTVIHCTTEIEVIDCFFELINMLNPDIIIGFNIYGFDFDFIIGKLQYYLHHTIKCSRPVLDHFTIEEMDWESSAYGYNRYKKINIKGRIIFDMMLYFRRFKLEKYSLDVISQHFLNEKKEDMSYTEMFECFRTRQGLDKVASYCIQDSLLVLKLFDKFHVWNELCEMSKVMRCSIEDLYTRGEQLKVTNQMIKECIDRDVVLVTRPTTKSREFDGAMVLDPVRGIHNNCIVLDFQSLYPSIVIAFNICPSTYKSNFSAKQIGLFPRCIQNLLTARKKVKQQMKDIQDPIETIVLDKKQNALKICANSMYGTMGFASNKYFGCIPCAERVTMIGREVLTGTVDFIRTNFTDVNIIYGDTDSCMLQFPETLSPDDCIKYATEIASKVTVQLPEPMALNFEEYYQKMILMNKKRYIMMKQNGTLKYKGVMIARRGYCQYAKDIYKEVIMRLAKEETIDSLKEYIDTKIIDLFSGKVDLRELTITKSVKAISEYKSDVPQVVMARRLIEEQDIEINAGTRLEYIFVHKDDPKCNQGAKMYTPEEVISNNLKVDYKYYIEKQIVSQVDELLDLVGLTNYVKNWFSHF